MPFLKTFLCLLLVLCSATALGQSAGAEPKPQATLTADALRAHYAKITAFTASVDQEKTARFLARPLKSEIALSMKDGRIDWRTLKPVASAIAIDANGIHLEGNGSSGAAEALAAASKDPRATAFIGFLRALFALDFDAIEKDFALTFEGRTMRALPKEGSNLSSLIHAIAIDFRADLAIERVVVKTPDETTTLHFKSFVPAHPPSTDPEALPSVTSGKGN
ncbi:MAG: hypothetical protein LBM75_05635 [Myxococcales bacterium]|nr:hypothetical protein [Myxococcales bacterium]